jgi:hypothetical protein
MNTFLAILFAPSAIALVLAFASHVRGTIYGRSEV